MPIIIASLWPSQVIGTLRGVGAIISIPMIKTLRVRSFCQEAVALSPLRRSSARTHHKRGLPRRHKASGFLVCAASSGTVRLGSGSHKHQEGAIFIPVALTMTSNCCTRTSWPSQRITAHHVDTQKLREVTLRRLLGSCMPSKLWRTHRQMSNSASCWVVGCPPSSG